MVTLQNENNNNKKTALLAICSHEGQWRAHYDVVVMNNEYNLKLTKVPLRYSSSFANQG